MQINKLISRHLNIKQSRRNIVNGINYYQCFCSSSSSSSSHSNGSNDNNGTNHVDIKNKILLNAIEKQYQVVYGWNNQAIIQSCKDLNVSPVVHTTLTRGPVEMVEFYLNMKHQHVMDKLKIFQLQQTTTVDDTKRAENDNENIKSESIPPNPLLSRSEILKFVMNTHLDYMQPCKSTWPDALALLTEPSQAPYTAEIMLSSLNDICSAMGIETARYEKQTQQLYSFFVYLLCTHRHYHAFHFFHFFFIHFTVIIGICRYDWYTERASLMTLFALTEFYLVQDDSDNSADTRYVNHHVLFVTL